MLECSLDPKGYTVISMNKLVLCLYSRVLPDTDLAGYPANNFVISRISGKIVNIEFKKIYISTKPAYISGRSNFLHIEKVLKKSSFIRSSHHLFNSFCSSGRISGTTLINRLCTQNKIWVDGATSDITARKCDQISHNIPNLKPVNRENLTIMK